MAGEYVIPSEANYQRFCSNFMAGAEHGFDREIVFTNEEATDFVNRTGEAWPARAGAEQAGVVVAYDVASGEYKSIYGMGRHNHENSVAVPGYGHPVVLSGDDTFSCPGLAALPLQSRPRERSCGPTRVTLYGFRSNNAAINDYGDLSGATSVAGTFIPVPEAIAKGDQTALENWSNANNVFQFIRIEDIAYDRTDPNVVYFADTGEPRALPNPATGRLMRGPATARGPWPNGRSVPDGARPGEPAERHQPVDPGRRGRGRLQQRQRHAPARQHRDDCRTASSSRRIPGGHNQGQTTARIWRYDISDKTQEVIARVDQSQRPESPLGAWESSGIIDASAAFGEDWFLVDVQAGTLIVEEERAATSPTSVRAASSGC